MGSFSIWHWLIVLMYAVVVGWPLWRIVGKTGFNPALSLTLHVPVLNILAILYLAFAKWPASRD